MKRDEIEARVRKVLASNASVCLDDPTDFDRLSDALTPMVEEIVQLVCRSPVCNYPGCDLELRGTYWQTAEYGDICGACHKIYTNH